MKNPDNEKSMQTVLDEMKLAIEAGDEKKAAEAFLNYGRALQENIIEEARISALQSVNDTNILTARGVQQLTNEEKKYYNAIIDGTFTGNQNGSAFDGTENMLPPTVIDRIFDELTLDHELLSVIKFRPAAATTQFIVNTGDVPTAYWGKLSAKIKELMTGGFKTLSMNLYKLCCYIPVSKSMLLLGPEWLDRYVREILVESMSLALEIAIIAGDGKDCPIGMTRDVEDGNHPEKTAAVLTNLEPVTLGTYIMAPLTKGGKRKVSGVILIVNPKDYWEKIFGATTYLNALGEYVYKILPADARFIQSSAMPIGKMVAGMPKNYFMGVGFESGIGYSDEVRYIDDERVYLTKMAANGRPDDNESYLLFDISGIQPSLTIKVNTSGTGTQSQEPDTETEQ